MSEMYEFVRSGDKNGESRRKRRKEWLTAVLLIAAVAVLIVIGIVIGKNITTGKRFSAFCVELSDNTDYAYRRRSATADTGDGAYKLDRESVYELYQCVCTYGPGHETGSAPDGDTVTVDYGNGSVMLLVQTGEGSDRRLYFSFTGRDGYTHCFYTEYLQLDYVVGRYLKPEA